MTFLLAKFNDMVSRKLPQPVNYVCYNVFNANTLAKHFAQVHILYQQKRITWPFQACKLDQIGFTLKQNLTGIKSKRHITLFYRRTLSARTACRYLYRIFALVASFADDYFVLLAPVFKRPREPSLSNGVSRRKASQLYRVHGGLIEEN